MTKELRDYLIKTYELKDDVKDGALELTYPREVAAYEAGYEAGRHQWHYPSKGELPKLGDKVLIKAHGRDDVVVGSISYPNAFTVSLKRWEIQTDDVDRFYSDKEILAWQYLPEPPKEV